jgi:predicted RNase H-like HicB family nuclease
MKYSWNLSHWAFMDYIKEECVRPGSVRIANAIRCHKDQPMKETFSAVVWKEGNWYVAQCREFEVASQGQTKEEALKNLAEAIELHLSPPVATIIPEVVYIEAEVESGVA